MVGLEDGTARCWIEGGAILVANMVRRQRDLAGHVPNQFTASSGCILLNGSFCFGYLRGQAAFFASLPPPRNCSLTEGAGKQGMILLLAGNGNVAFGSYWHYQIGHGIIDMQRNHTFCAEHEDKICSHVTRLFEKPKISTHKC